MTNNEKLARLMGWKSKMGDGTREGGVSKDREYWQPPDESEHWYWPGFFPHMPPAYDSDIALCFSEVVPWATIKHGLSFSCINSKHNNLWNVMFCRAVDGGMVGWNEDVDTSVDVPAAIVRQLLAAIAALEADNG